VQFVDTDPRIGWINGSISFGPNMREGLINQTGVSEYWLHFVDLLGRRLGDVVAAVPAVDGLPDDCCPSQAYTVNLAVALPLGFSRLAIAPVVDGMLLPRGALTEPILDFVGDDGTGDSTSTQTTTEGQQELAQVVLVIETPLRAELLTDTVTLDTLGECLQSELALPPDTQVELEAVEASAGSDSRAELVYSLRAPVGAAPPLGGAATTTGAMDLAQLEQNFSSCLAAVGSESYDVKVVSLSIASAEGAGNASSTRAVPPPLPEGDEVPEAAMAAAWVGVFAGTCIVGVVSGFLSALACLTRKKDKVLPYRSSDEVQEGEAKEEEVKEWIADEVPRYSSPPSGSPSPAIPSSDGNTNGAAGSGDLAAGGCALEREDAARKAEMLPHPDTRAIPEAPPPLLLPPPLPPAWVGGDSPTVRDGRDDGEALASLLAARAAAGAAAQADFDGRAFERADVSPCFSSVIPSSSAVVPGTRRPEESLARVDFQCLVVMKRGQ